MSSRKSKCTIGMEDIMVEDGLSRWPRLLMKNGQRDNLVRFPAGGQIIYEECVKG